MTRPRGVLAQSAADMARRGRGTFVDLDGREREWRFDTSSADRPAVRFVLAARVAGAHHHAAGRVPAARFVGGPPPTIPMRLPAPTRARALVAARVVLVVAAVTVLLSTGAGWWWSP